MSDVSRVELQYTLDGICKYLKKNRNHLAQDLYRQMHRSDCLGGYGYIEAQNELYTITLKVKRRKTNGS